MHRNIRKSKSAQAAVTKYHDLGDRNNIYFSLSRDLVPLSLFLSPLCKDTAKKVAVYKRESSSSPRIRSASTLILDFPVSRTMRNKCKRNKRGHSKNQQSQKLVL